MSRKNLFSPKLAYGPKAEAISVSKAMKRTFSGEFSVLLDEGNYGVKLTFNHPEHSTAPTIKVEDRRAMRARVQSQSSESETLGFMVKRLNQG